MIKNVILLFVYLLYLIFIIFNIEIYTYIVNIIIFILLCIYGIYILIGINKKVSLIIKEIFIIFILGIFIGYILHIVVFSISYSLLLGLLIGTILYLLFERKLYKNDLKYNFNYILSIQLTFILIFNLLVLINIDSFVPRKDKNLYISCFDNDCFEANYMIDPFFFGENFIQINYYNKNYPYIVFGKNKIYSRDISNNLIIEYKDGKYIINYNGEFTEIN